MTDTQQGPGDKEDNGGLEDNKHLSITSQFAIEMLTLQSVEEVWWHLARNVVAKLGFVDVVIYELDRSAKVLRQVAAFGKKDGQENVVINPIDIPFGRGVVGRVAAEQKTLRIDDTRLFKDYIVDDVSRLSELAVPLMVDGELIGVIDSEHPEPHFFTDAHVYTVTAIASIASVKVSQKNSVDALQGSIVQLKKSVAVQDALFEMAELIFSADTMDEFYRGVHACVGKLTIAGNFYIAQRSEDKLSIDFPYYIDDHEEGFPYGVIPIDPDAHTITSYVLEHNQPLLLFRKDIVKMAEDQVIQIQGKIPAAWLGVPFGSNDQRGLVAVQSYDDAKLFDEEDKQLMSFVAKHIRSALERKNSALRMQFLALHDPLTNLPNRELFQDRVQQAIVACENERRENLSIMFVDLDRFKQVNDTYGHFVGDRLLIEVSTVILSCIRVTDTLSRLGGDEFAILLEDSAGISSAEKVAKKIIQALEKSISIGPVELAVSVSIGITEYMVGSKNQDVLFSHADNAMYQAKLRGRNQYVVSSGGSDDRQLTIAKLSHDFPKALSEKEFYLEYQPIVNMVNGKMYGVEALVRWRHETLGVIPPNLFIPELERSGQIIALDQYVISRAIERVQDWSDWLPSDFKINVNISTAGISSQKLVSMLEKSVQEGLISVGNLCFEITEESLASNVLVVQKNMRRLREMGVSLALDDFGTGYSSLSYLHQFEFDILKIDRSFISRLDHGQDKNVIIEAIVNMAQSLGMSTVAEGVETLDQYNILLQLGSRNAQGYYMARPQSAEGIKNLVRAGLPLNAAVE